jgi:hypothetical protein
MTSVLYSAGLNYQSGNPVRQEINAVRNDVNDIRKQLETLTEENNVYRKYLIKLLKAGEHEELVNEMTRELMAVNNIQPMAQGPGQNTVQGGGFRR